MPADSNRRSVVVITGASSGIGQAAAILALRGGARVAALGLAPPSAPTGEWSAAEEAGDLLFAECDVRVEGDVEAAFARASAALGPVTGAICSAGIDTGAPSHELSMETWHKVVETNLTGTFLTCRAAIRSFRESGHPGAIVCISSPWSFVAPRVGGAAAYAASKGGVSSLVRALSVEYAGAGIRVNAVTPGATETELMWANVAPEDLASTRVKINEEVPFGRLADPEEPARAALWLLGPEAGYITGANLTCDGGVLAAGVLTV
ncbi:hypothetical protein GCM10009555_103020 [Acrocarpospora macrocephala]|uniref:Ketoreductase domain-containing protein n=1 Tax=Acrocarpospora macrocephala TaxID=150177 RepID=A0A5M3WEE9_9ACTN|nr:SDR family oxidoreductase [Acrocarpospora macrocephala]GES07226.1 hypothetical protein Amac_008210 [Acrocarpospora macrocephala]